MTVDCSEVVVKVAKAKDCPDYGDGDDCFYQLALILGSLFLYLKTGCESKIFNISGFQNPLEIKI